MYTQYAFCRNLIYSMICIFAKASSWKWFWNLKFQSKSGHVLFLLASSLGSLVSVGDYQLDVVVVQKPVTAIVSVSVRREFELLFRLA